MSSSKWIIHKHRQMSSVCLEFNLCSSLIPNRQIQAESRGCYQAGFGNMPVQMWG